ncbi:hypothetical protein P692DRAFT_20737370 [Suillus brevipes Sb2]|nr:hypothetical protein P692DRAFT_20737370 [Suillus brevipes Sb2]
MCPACGRHDFKTSKGLLSHMGQAKGCQWYCKGKLRDLGNPGTFEHAVIPDALVEDGEDMNVDEGDRGVDEWDPQDAQEAWNQELFDLIPTQPPTDRAPARSESPEVEEPIQGSSRRVLNVDEDQRVVVEHPTAGAIMREGETFVESWCRHILGDRLQFDGDGDVDMEGVASQKYSPFASEVEWRVAQWATKEGVGHKSLDRLLSIPGVVENLGLSFHNSRAMHQIVDTIPSRSLWHTTYLSFPDDPEERHMVQYRDPLEAIRTLLGNPAHAETIVYKPCKVFSDESKENRIYSEMWTGKWWHALQVR